MSSGPPAFDPRHAQPGQAREPRASLPDQTVLLLHGFTGSARSWDPLVAALGPRLQALAVDLVGHGPAPPPTDPSRYTMAACVRDLLDLLDARGLRQVGVVGYSMGGRVALHLALAAPRRVSALVLASASAGLEDPRERAERVASDEALAALIERDGLEAFVDRWERLPLLALGPHVADEVRAGLRAQRLENHPRGLALSLRGMGAGRPPPVWDRLPELDLPVLLVVGARDTRYRALAERMRRLLPRARLEVLQDAGHLVYLEQPAALASLVEEFVLRLKKTQCRMLA